MSPNLAEHIKPSKFIGLNQLGRLHMTVRDIVSEHESQNCNSNFDVSSTHLISTTPHDVPTTDFSTTEHIISQTLPLNGKTTSPPVSESIERINSSMQINHPLTVTQDELNTVDHSQNVKSVNTPNSPPLKPRDKRSITRSTVKNVNTLDNYIKKDTPTSKRKLSSDTISPSSVQVAKTSRTDEGEGGS